LYPVSEVLRYICGSLLPDDLAGSASSEVNMRCRHVAQSVAFVVLIGLLLLAPLAQAQGPTPPPPPPHGGTHYGIDQQGLLSRLPGAQPPARAADQANAPACAPWSKLTFASYRDNNWEVYKAQGDGTGQTRLTNRAEVDTAPKFNRGCTRIAYQSLLGSQYEVFAMNADGSGQTNLTNHPANDGLPCWSPDGTRIAFQSDRDGNNEIYAMNADGTGQTRLTNHSAYDGMPAWSSDGTKIAFISNRTNVYDYDVWVINADGTGPTQITTNLWQQAEYPCWSPDDSQIAFSTDDNSDGFMDVAVVNANGTGFRHLAGHVNAVDYWYPAWSPDGEWIAYGRTELIQYQGQWYWTRSDIYAQGAPATTGCYHPVTALVASGYDWRPHWGTSDAQPPTSQIQSLPLYTGLLDPIRWFGQDVGPAGIWSYDVQYRDGEAGTWSGWLVNTRDTIAYFTGTAGHTYYFRCRARDRAGNVGSYPSTGPYPHTMFYTYRLSGRVDDSRDTPVSQAAVDIAPPPLYSVVAGSTGNYEAYLTGMDGHTVSVSKTNYGTLPLMPISADQLAQPVDDVMLHTALPPADDAMRSGGFESGSLEPDWLAGGEVMPILTGVFQHSGSGAVGLGQQNAVVPVQNLSHSAGTAASARMTMDANGILYVVWRDSSPGNNDIYYAQRGSNGVWSSPYNISNTPGDSQEPQLTVDSGGVVHVVWQDASGVYYARRESLGTWSGAQKIANTSSPSPYPRLGVDGQGVVHVVWNNYPSGYSVDKIYHTRRDTSGNWSSPQLISGDYWITGGSELVVSSNGRVHVAWEYEGSSNQSLYYVRRESNGIWANPEVMPEGSWVVHDLQLAVDENDTAHLAWLGDIGDGIMEVPYYTQRKSDGTWLALLQVPNADYGAISMKLAAEQNGVVHIVWWGSIYSSGGLYYARRTSDGWWSSPQRIANVGSLWQLPLAVDENRNVHLVWADSAGLCYTRRWSDGVWSAVRAFSDAEADSQWPRPQMTVNSNGVAHVVWYRVNGGKDIYYCRPHLVGQTSDSSITQAITVSNAMHYPTLSFMYRFGGTNSAGGNWLEASIASSINSTQIFSTSSSTNGWTHHWVDMGPWAGQIVTLTFNIHETTGGYRTWAYLDEVSLGSAYPNLWVGKSSSTTPPGGGPVRYTITYGNLGGVPAQGVRITDTLPISVTFISASVPPTSTSPLVWDVGNLAAGVGPYTIIVTATVAAGTPAWTIFTNTVTISGATPEADLDNNTAVAQTFVGYRLYLTLAARDG
jgi:TolB protein